MDPHQPRQARLRAEPDRHRDGFRRPAGRQGNHRAAHQCAGYRTGRAVSRHRAAGVPRPRPTTRAARGADRAAGATQTDHRRRGGHQFPTCRQPRDPRVRGAVRDSAVRNQDRKLVMTEAFLYEALRTPRGKGKPTGALHSVKPISLVTGLIVELRNRYPSLDPKRIDDIVLGVVAPIADQGGDLPRAAVLAAGLPDTVAGLQINRFCASGLEAVNLGAMKVRSGWEDLLLTGGGESMARGPMGSDGGAFAMGPETAYAPRFVPQGISADLIATVEGFTREDVAAYAPESQHRAAKAWSNGYFHRSVVPVRDLTGTVVLDRDEHLRPDTTMAGLAALNPSFADIGEQAGFDAVALQRYHWVERIE